MIRPVRGPKASHAHEPVLGLGDSFFVAAQLMRIGRGSVWFTVQLIGPATDEISGLGSYDFCLENAWSGGRRGHASVVCGHTSVDNAFCITMEVGGLLQLMLEDWKNGRVEDGGNQGVGN
jgi:hypothetical protein